MSLWERLERLIFCHRRPGKPREWGERERPRTERGPARRGEGRAGSRSAAGPERIAVTAAAAAVAGCYQGGSGDPEESK